MKPQSQSKPSSAAVCLPPANDSQEPACGLAQQALESLPEQPLNAIVYLKQLAQAMAVQRGIPYRVEQSARSEAVYFKLFSAGHWYGLRIASHEPAYDSSADAQQVLVPQWVYHPQQLAAAREQITQEIALPSHIVADPDEVAAALAAQQLASRHGRLFHGTQRSVWQWHEPTTTWHLLRVGTRGATERLRCRYEALRPTHEPVGFVTPLQESAIRHRLNLRAKWAAVEQRQFDELARGQKDDW